MPESTKSASGSLCTQCASTFAATASYCGFDGSALVVCAKPIESVGHSNFHECSLCNRQYPTYAKFCGADGSPLTKEESFGLIAKKTTGTRLEVQQSVPQAGSDDALNIDEDDWRPSSDLDLVGRTLEGKYQIKSVLAEGGMAVLYLAHHVNMERTVVVKVVHSNLISSPSANQRFERECKLVARLNHPNIVQVYDFGFMNKRQPFMVMEFIKGNTLADFIDKQGPPLPTTALRIITQICSGLEEAHVCGIIHRDLKPDNIILQEKIDRPDWVKIVDFGIAHLLDGSKRLTRSGRITGTPEYMSPEQFKDKPIDVRADVYALGIVLFEIFTGAVPFSADDLGVLMAKHLMEDAPSICEFRDDIAVDSPIDLMVKKCLMKDPDQRYQTVAELRKAAEEALSKV
ncbi:MAG: serine/threonine-protein kinase [Candidatus Obscuribacterales bacterium]|nr:serine/threonine-protein kinase [Candidatus Obscuribacterales bacterium]